MAAVVCVLIGGAPALVQTAAGVALQGELTCPCTIWAPTSVPPIVDDNDLAATEVGTRFRSDADGYITGIRFYKAPLNTGTHTGRLWSQTGTLLASVTFTNETASGWQEATFAAAVPITAHTTYVVSYHAPVGHYTGTDGFFAQTALDRPPLHGLQDGVDGANGVYRYGAGGVFPTSTYLSEGYWVDVVFNTTSGTVSITDATVTEGHAGSVTAILTVTLSSISAQTVTVAYATANGTATAGSDYTATSGTLTFLPGVTSQPIAIAVTGDRTVESNETILVNLTLPVNTRVLDGQGVITITDDETPITGLVAAYGFSEGSGTTTADASGAGQTGSISGATWTTQGRHGPALSFDGVDDLVTIADTAALDVTRATVMAWVRPTTLSGWRTAVLKETATGLAYALYAHDEAPRPAGYINVAGDHRNGGRHGGHSTECVDASGDVLRRRELATLRERDPRADPGPDGRHHPLGAATEDWWQHRLG